MMDNDNQEKQNGAVTEETGGQPMGDISNNATPIPSSITGEVPNDKELNNTKTIQSTKMSTGELENSSSNEDNTTQDLSAPNTERSSNPVPLLPNSESTLPLIITLTPVTQENFESDSTDHLHFYINYNSDGTITAYPIYPCDPESPAVDQQSQSQLPKIRMSLGSDPSAFHVYQFQDPASVSQVFAQNNVPVSQAVAQNNVPESQGNESSCQVVDESNDSLCHAISEIIAHEFQKYTENSYPVFQENRKETPFYPDVHNNAPVYEDVNTTVPVYQSVQSNAQCVQGNVPLYPLVPINAPSYQDVHSKASLHEDVQSNVPLHPDIQKYPTITGQHVHNNESNFQEAKCDDDSSFTSWRGRQAAVESKLVAAVRAIAWENPKFIRLFKNGDKRFHRNRNPAAKVETDVPVSEIPLPSSRMSTTLNELSLSRTSFQVETQTTIFSILKDPLPVDHTFTKSSIILPHVDSLPVENLFETSENFGMNVPISEIPLPKDTPEVTLPLAVLHLNSAQAQKNSSISEIPLAFNDGSTGRSYENSNTLSSAVSLEKSAKNYEINFPISDIPLPLDPICKNSEKLNKLLIDESSVFVPNNSPTGQTSATRHDKTKTELRYTFLQESILNISKESIDSEKIISEFSEKCRIFGDNLKNTKACLSENYQPTENLDLNVNDKDTQNSLHKTHQSRTETTSMNKDKSDITSNNHQDKQKNPNDCQQLYSTSFNSKGASSQSKLQVDVKSIKQVMSSKLSINDTEINPRQETENQKQLKNISTSNNINKETDIRKKSIFGDIRKDSDIPLDWLNKKKNNSKLEIENGKSKLHMTKFENKSLKTSESGNETNLPRVDLKSEMDKIIPKTLPIDSKVKTDRIILKPISRNKKYSASQLRIAASENKTDVSSNSASAKTKIDVTKIQITDYGKQILPNAARVESRLKADISPKDAKAKVAFLKPNTKKGMERILFSENCVALSGPTAFVESGAARKTTPKKSVSPQILPPAVIRTLLRHRDTVQRFLEIQKPGSEGPKHELILSEDTAKIQDLVEQKPKIEAAENETIETTPKSSKSRKRRSKKKNVRRSPAEKDIKDFEPDITG